MGGEEGEDYHGPWSLPGVGVGLLQVITATRGSGGGRWSRGYLVTPHLLPWMQKTSGAPEEEAFLATAW